VLSNTMAKYTATEDYPIGVPAEVAEALVGQIEQSWGTDAAGAMVIPSRTGDARFGRWFAKLQRIGASPSTVQAFLRAVLEVDVRPLLPLIHAPALVLHRKDYPFIPVQHGRYLAAHIPGAKLVELPGADASLVWEAPELALDLIEQFLTGVRRPAKPSRVLATLLFTDIVGSTARASRLGDRRWRELLNVHDEIARQLVEEFGGRLGPDHRRRDLGHLRWPRSRDPLRDGPARGAKEELKGIGLQIRAGLHTGEVELRDGDLGGMAVHIAARVMAAAGPGEVLTSRTVRDLVVGSDVALDDRGMQPLKGVEGTWQLFAVMERRPAALDRMHLCVHRGLHVLAAACLLRPP
jgi:class 3 adenylate cyclase